MKKSSLSKIICLFFFVAVIISGCSFTGLDKYSQNLNEYNINLQFNDENKSLSGTQTVNYINSTDIVLTNVDFHLYPNAFKRQETTQKVVSDFNYDRAYPNGFDSGYIDIREVKVKNKDATYSFCESENSIISVELGEKLYPEERIEIKFSYEIKIPNIHHRFGYGDNTINIGNFYPIACIYEDGGFVHDGYHYNGDPFYSQMANYNVEITYPSKYEIGSSGECVKTEENAGCITKNFEAIVVRDFAFVLSEKFEVQKSKYEDTSIYYMFYKDEEPAKTLQLIEDALKTFNNLIGEYPYSTLTVVQSNFIHGGMEYSNIVLISDEVEITSEYYNVIVHEIAHQWFYNIIGNNEVSEAWLDEGLTEYVTAMFYDLNEGYGTTYDDIVANMLNSYLLFVDVYEDVFGGLDTSMNRSLQEFGSEYEYTYMVYVKSVLMLDTLRDVLGDANFCLGLKTYYENNKFKIATKEHFIRDFSKVSSTDIKGLVNSWVEGKVQIKN
ncbi:MAG: M1 family metallopeptidase [Clostridia bacterium]|nr:M1 family metallopeptidase [Clostridia bacterium]